MMDIIVKYIPSTAEGIGLNCSHDKVMVSAGMVYCPDCKKKDITVYEVERLFIKETTWNKEKQILSK